VSSNRGKERGYTCSLCISVSRKTHPSRSDDCIIEYGDYYRKRSMLRLAIPHWGIYFPRIKSQECRGINDFENYCTNTSYNKGRSTSIPRRPPS
jgi:hypothetical protein